MGTFEPQRPDGRSDRQIILDLVMGAAPERVFGYPEIEEALQQDVDGTITRERAGRAVRAANKTLLRAEKRYLDNQRGVGYRVLPAAEHRLVSIRRQTRAEREMRKGIEVIKHVRLEDLDDTQRRLAIGQLTVMNGMYMLIQGQQQRQDRMDKLFEGLEQRMTQIEQRGPHQGSGVA